MQWQHNYTKVPWFFCCAFPDQMMNTQYVVAQRTTHIKFIINLWPVQCAQSLNLHLKAVCVFKPPSRPSFMLCLGVVKPMLLKWAGLQGRMKRSPAKFSTSCFDVTSSSLLDMLCKVALIPNDWLDSIATCGRFRMQDDVVICWVFFQPPEKIFSAIKHDFFLYTLWCN